MKNCVTLRDIDCVTLPPIWQEAVQASSSTNGFATKKLV